MNPIPLWQVDAFTEKPFGGNPAAVCLLDREVPDEWMQAVAAEMNLSETSFVRSAGGRFELRWFTPAVEVDLCGHATLAAAHALWSAGAAAEGAPIEFATKSGTLACTRAGGWIEMDFPALPAEAAPPPPELLESLSVREPICAGRTRFDALLEVASADELRSLRPDFRKLALIPVRGVIVTAAYWSARLGRPELIAYQASRRGGVLKLSLRENRVLIAGRAAAVSRGELLAAPPA